MRFLLPEIFLAPYTLKVSANKTTWSGEIILFRILIERINNNPEKITIINKVKINVASTVNYFTGITFFFLKKGA